MKLYIKNMVCDRCTLAVKNELEKHHLSYHRVALGEVELTQEPTPAQLIQLDSGLIALGFERIEDRQARIVSKIKTLVIDWVRDTASKKKINLSTVVTEALNKDYASLSTLFSQAESITIEHFAILQKIEYVKELLVYDELSLNEIASLLQYSSVQHLSGQFKKVTSFTPSAFRKNMSSARQPLDRI